MRKYVRRRFTGNVDRAGVDIVRCCCFIFALSIRCVMIVGRPCALLQSFCVEGQGSQSRVARVAPRGLIHAGILLWTFLWSAWTWIIWR